MPEPVAKKPSVAIRATSFLFKFMRRHPLLTASIFLLAVILIINAMAFIHAWRMTHFSSTGTRTSHEHKSFLQKIPILLGGVNLPRPSNTTTPEDDFGSYATCSIATPDGETLEAWFVSKSNAKGTVLLFHGYAAAKSDCLKEARAFYDMGYSTFLVDFRGCGGSTGNTTSIGYHEAIDVDAALTYAPYMLTGKPMILYAKSMGSAAILGACSRLGTKPDAIILETPFDRLLTTVSNRFDAMGLPAIPLAHLLVYWGGVQNGFDGFAHNPTDYAKGTNAPCLLMAGKKDTRVTPDQAREIYQNLAGPKQFTLFAGAGHVSLIKADKSQWIKEIEQFLEANLP